MISEDPIDIMVEVENLNVQFGKKQIVRNVSFNVNKGEIIGMFGISGAGKTTIIRVLTCQIEQKHWSGKVNVTRLSPKKKKKSRNNTE
ncbi:MAG: ATP-binding cassette domain-containing protein [Candidatus Heimdallarchaeota archaeon]